jgi:type IV secretion system protein VirD4
MDLKPISKSGQAAFGGGIQSMRKDEQIIIVQGHSPIRCGRAIYFRRKEMDEAAKVNRFAKF